MKSLEELERLAYITGDTKTAALLRAILDDTATYWVEKQMQLEEAKKPS